MKYLSISITFLILLFQGNTLRADHLAGGYIGYRYIGDSTGVPHEYQLSLHLYLDAQGVSLPSFSRIEVRSQCYSSQNVIVNLTSGTGKGNVPEELFDCIGTQTGIKVVDHYQYVGRVVLPGPCTYFTFSYKSCCRPGGFSNAQANSGFYIESWLSNNHGPNDSPHFRKPPVSGTCIQAIHRWDLGGEDENGDSLFYSLVDPRTDFNSTVPFFNHFSAVQPISSIPAATLDASSGIYQIHPYQVETDILTIRCDEYRRNSIGGWTYVGTVFRDATLNITRNCLPDVSAGLFTDISTKNHFIDPLSGHQGFKFQCGTSKYEFSFQLEVDPGTFHVDDIQISDDSGSPVHPDSIKMEKDEDGRFRTLVIYPPTIGFEPGTYYLSSQEGSDGNTILNTCGFPWKENDTVILEIGKCPDWIGRDPSGPPKEVQIPNVFTPNEDGLNDAFYIPFVDSFRGDRYVIILDRWGNKIYETRSYSNMNPWRGEMPNGRDCPEGAYFFIVRLQDPATGAVIEKEGVVSLLRKD
ncbi:MAG: gliding motility-associated C-terminal domain-containing protein [Bacteroidota bacterium]|nr:gliding motility-associated C-terminal domain-containing protein [Bacteroidota bacterium]